MNRSIRTLVAALAVTAATAAGCSSDDDSDAGTTAAPVTDAATTAPASSEAATTVAPETTAGTGKTGDAGTGSELTIEGFAFSGGPFTANEPITIVNKDSAPHTVTADDDSFSVNAPAGETATVTITAPGEYAIHCNVHPRMTATITVE